MVGVSRVNDFDKFSPTNTWDEKPSAIMALGESDKTFNTIILFSAVQ